MIFARPGQRARRLRKERVAGEDIGCLHVLGEANAWVVNMFDLFLRDRGAARNGLKLGWFNRVEDLKADLEATLSVILVV